MNLPRGWIPIMTGLALAFAAAAVTVAAQGQGRADRDYRRPTVVRGTPARPLTPPGIGRAADRARQYVRENRQALGLNTVEVDDLVITGESTSGASRVSHVFVRQRIAGVEVFGADANLSVAADGSILTFGHSLFPDISATVSGSLPSISAVDGALAASRFVGLEPTSSFEVTESRGGAEQATLLTDGGVATGPIAAKLVYQPVGPRELRLAWQVDLEEASGLHLWRMTVDAETSEVLHQEDYTFSDNWDLPVAGVDAVELSARETARAEAAELASPNGVNDGSAYRVFAHPTESPNDGPRSLVTNPADSDGSPFGWHDADGVAGAEFTVTRGNNVHAYLDQDRNNQPDAGADVDGGATLAFDFPADLDEHAQSYRDAVVTNLFYWNNAFHDIMWRYGFDEASGNFQANNYGRDGGQGDYVRAEAADGNGTNNANFSTPAADAGTPRMQMFLWPGNQFGPQNEVIVGGVSYGASWARFSPAPSVAGTTGQVFDAGNGCVAADYAGAPAGDWIAIVTGGDSGCPNIDKSREAGLAGGRALIVAATTGDTAPILTGSLTTPGPTIPVASVSPVDGAAIRAAVMGAPLPGTVRKHPDHPGIRDGDFDAGIVMHEYGHGVSNRLTGGPGINCLSGNEQAGEGWSDFLALVTLLNPALDDPQGPRGLVPYALFQGSRQANGLRPRPYSRDMTIQPFTYDSIKTEAWLNGVSLSTPHGIGHGWAATLWDMAWDLVDKHGFNPDVYAAWDTGGNNRSLQYVVDGLKFQGCGPGFVAARDGILAAAEALGGEDTCTVWAAFARRGLGYSAVQGTTNRNDNTEAFDTAPACRAGFRAPVSQAPGILNERDAGSVVPLKFDAGTGLGDDPLASNSPFSRRIDCATGAVPSIGEFITPREYPEPTSQPGGSGLSQNPHGVFHYNWQTEATWAGTCRELVLTRKDGVQHRAFFQFVAPD